MVLRVDQIMNVLKECLWIGGDEDSRSPVIVRRFTVDNIEAATLTITGLGYFEAKINGRPVTAYRFLPVVSDYEPRNLKSFVYPLSDITTNRIYYYVIDITDLINVGNNLLEIQLGNGFYRQKERIAEGDVSFGNVLKTIYKLNIGEKCICSDGSETFYDSEIRYNNIFYGEIVDATTVKTEKPVNILPAPKSELTEAKGTPDAAVRTVKPKRLSSTVYDVGENISGVVQVKTSAEKGEKITIRFAENINFDGNLDFISTGSDYVGASGKPQIQEDIFICNGTARIFEPKFVWHAFRYFEIVGTYDSVEVIVIHSNTPVTSTFYADSEGFQFLYDAFIRTQLNNMHGSFPSDCPHRERLGYTGDGQVCSTAAMMMLDCREFYEKWIQDILDCQDKISGHVQHTAPLMGGGGGPGGWGSAIVFVPYNFYLQYGDIGILKKCYEPMKKWIHYLETRLEGYLLTHEEIGGWCLGDWSALDGIKIPAEFVNNCSFIKQLDILTAVSELLHYDGKYYLNLKGNIGQAVINKFYADGSFAGGIQAADAFAVWCGLGNNETAQNVAMRYDELGYFDTGFIGTDILLEVLFEYGYADVAFKLLENDKQGSFLYMKRHGATTLWESWNGENSHNHPMFGGGARVLFTYILGIRQKQGTAGYSDIIIKPCTPSKMSFAGGSIMTPKGKISVCWERTDGKIKYDINVPDGIRAEYL